MKVLIATDQYYPDVNGAAYYVYRLAHELADSGDEVGVIAPAKKFKHALENEGNVRVFRVRSIPIPMFKDFRISPTSLIASRIYKIMGKFRPDVVHIQTHYMVGKVALAAAKSYGIPVVGTNHFMPENLVHYLHLPQFAEREIIKLGWEQFKDVYNEVDVVTTPTQTAAKLLKRIGFTKEVIPVSCGIDLTKYNPRNKSGYLAKRYHIPTNIPVILYVGRLDKEKNVDTLVRAMPILLKKQNVHLVLAGKGFGQKAIKDLVHEMEMDNYVTFTGFVPDNDLPNIFTLADVFIAPGSAELQCMAALEALASGIPLVVANAVALPELVPGNKNGFQFTLKSPKSLAEKVQKILSGKKLTASMRSESIKLAKKHDINKVLKDIHKIYKKVIAENTGRKKPGKWHELRSKLVFPAVIGATLLSLSL
jgi:glycosyltransferase involved in cell wall biosynthesis